MGSRGSFAACARIALLSLTVLGLTSAASAASIVSPGSLFLSVGVFSCAAQSQTSFGSSTELADCNADVTVSTDFSPTTIGFTGDSLTFSHFAVGNVDNLADPFVFELTEPTMLVITRNDRYFTRPGSNENFVKLCRADAGACGGFSTSVGEQLLDPDVYRFEFRVSGFGDNGVDFAAHFVPEPGTGLLVMGGLLGSACRRRTLT
jgi:hypothetical protein